MTTRVIVEQLDPSRQGPFVRACWAGTALLPALPRSSQDWRRAIHDASAATRPVPRALAGRLADRQRALGQGVRASENARRLGEPGVLAVVTGQQPGLLGGPLLAAHKAAGALALARALEEEHGTPVVPVFWLASEDHDVEEANRLWLQDREGQVRRLRVAIEDADGRSLMDLEVPDAATDAFLAEVRGLLPDTERTGEILGRLRRRPGEGCATWCGRSLLEILGTASGLVLLEPGELLPYAGEILASLLERAGEIRAALLEAGARLEEAGFRAPLAPREDEAPLFLRDAIGGPRRRVSVDAAGRVTLRGAAIENTDVERVAARLRAEPRLGSGDAAGRVLVQDALLPVLAYLGGPTELAYHVQVRAAHDRLGLRYPLAIPRPEATWIDGKTVRNARAFGLEIADLLEDPDRLRAVAGSDDSPALEAALDRWVGALGRAPDDLRAHLEASGEGEGALARALRRLEGEGSKAAMRIRAAHARDRGVGADRKKRLEEALRPRGRPQERSLSPVSLAVRHGLDALREGLGALDPRSPGHYVIRLP